MGYLYALYVLKHFFPCSHTISEKNQVALSANLIYFNKYKNEKEHQNNGYS